MEIENGEVAPSLFVTRLGLTAGAFSFAAPEHGSLRHRGPRLPGPHPNAIPVELCCRWRIGSGVAGDSLGGVMPRFRKLPIEIEAEQWFPDETVSVGYDRHGVEYTVCDRSIQTLEGPMRVSPGDWIITGVRGEKYPCKPDIFALTYEPA